jgi:hypothetical protein
MTTSQPDNTALATKIAETLESGDFLSPSDAAQAAFHLTDWIDDLRRVIELYGSSEWNNEQAQKLLVAFVTHAPAHLAAAHRLILDSPVRDVFGIGAVESGNPNTKS